MASWSKRTHTGLSLPGVQLHKIKKGITRSSSEGANGWRITRTHIPTGQIKATHTVRDPGRGTKRNVSTWPPRRRGRKPYSGTKPFKMSRVEAKIWTAIVSSK